MSLLVSIVKYNLNTSDHFMVTVKVHNAVVSLCTLADSEMIPLFEQSSLVQQPYHFLQCLQWQNIPSSLIADNKALS